MAFKASLFTVCALFLFESSRAQGDVVFRESSGSCSVSEVIDRFSDEKTINLRCQGNGGYVSGRYTYGAVFILSYGSENGFNLMLAIPYEAGGAGRLPFPRNVQFRVDVGDLYTFNRVPYESGAAKIELSGREANRLLNQIAEGTEMTIQINNYVGYAKLDGSKSAYIEFVRRYTIMEGKEPGEGWLDWFFDSD